MLLQLDNNIELLANCDTSGALTFGHMTEYCAILMVTMCILVKYQVKYWVQIVKPLSAAM